MDKQMKHKKAQLLKERELILAHIGQADEYSLGDNIVELLIVFQMRDRLDHIEQALVRLEKGQFGVCRSCHRPINPKRLEIKPEADLCLNCQSQMEHRSYTPFKPVNPSRLSTMD